MDRTSAIGRRQMHYVGDHQRICCQRHRPQPWRSHPARKQTCRHVRTTLRGRLEPADRGSRFLFLPLPRIPEPTRSTRRPLREVRSLSLFNLIHQRDVGLFDRIELRIPCVGRVPRETLKASLKVRSFKITSPPGKDFVSRDAQLFLRKLPKSPATRMRLSESGIMKSPWGASLGSIRSIKATFALSILLSWGSHVWGWYQENLLNRAVRSDELK